MKRSELMDFWSYLNKSNISSGLAFNLEAGYLWKASLNFDFLVINFTGS